jgi:hypothetical protein
MVRDAPKAAPLTMRVEDFAAKQGLILRSLRSKRLEGRPPGKSPSGEDKIGDTSNFICIVQEAIYFCRVNKPAGEAAFKKPPTKLVDKPRNEVSQPCR